MDKIKFRKILLRTSKELFCVQKPVKQSRRDGNLPGANFRLKFKDLHEKFQLSRAGEESGLKSETSSFVV